jgi:hypothetical protein
MIRIWIGCDPASGVGGWLPLMELQTEQDSDGKTLEGVPRIADTTKKYNE